MNKRKMTSIALAAAVAISTVQLAYPANVFAQEQVKESKVENNTKEVSRNSQKFEVSKENELRDAINKANGTKENPTVIIITQDIELEEGIDIPKNKNIILQGEKKANIEDNISIKFSNTMTPPQDGGSEADKRYTTYAMFSLLPYKSAYENTEKKDGGNSSLTIKNLKLDGNNKARIIYTGAENDITIYDSILEKGFAYKVEGNTNSGGAVYMTYNSNFTMIGGEIRNNKSTRYAAGVYSFSSGVKISINGTKIHNNKSNSYGTITVLGSGKTYLKDCEITDNITESTNQQHGVGILYGSEGENAIYISGNVKVYNNYYENRPTEKIYDIYFNNDDSKIFITDQFTGNINLRRYQENLENKHLGMLYALGTSDYQITPEEASRINILEGNKMLNLEGNELILRPATKVTFNSNTGENSEEKTQKVAKNNEGENTLKTVLLKNAFTREGYTFLGWATEANGDVIYKDGDSISTDEEVMLYAKWIENSKTITYNPDVETSLGLGSSGITAKVKEGKDVISISEGKIKTIGVGDAIIEYSVGEIVIAEYKITVEPRETDVAIVNKIPYDNFDNVIKNLDNNQNITIINNETTKKGLELSKTLEIKGKKDITIDFNGVKLSSSKEKFDSLIKITDSTGITIKDANFDLSNGGDVAVLVEGNSIVSLEGKITSKKNNSDKAPVISLVGENAKATLIEGSTINGKLDPDSELIITDEKSKNNFTNENNTSSGGGSVPSIPSKPSKPTYTHEKIEGLDRYETATKIADKLGSYDTAVLVNATSTMSDGLSAAGLAGKEDAAILLVKKDSIPKATMDRLKKVKKVYIIGGENAISKKVSDEITKNVPKVEVERLGGKTRVETSELVAKEIGNYSNAFIVNGFKGEADAMSASAIAARYEAPILLTNGKTSTHAKKSGVEYYVVGGKNVVDKSIADKYNAEVLAGSDRYATNREVIDEFYSGSDKLYLANGDKLVDALTASPLAKNHGIVLVNKKSDKSILKDKHTVQVGGMDFEIDFE